MYWDDGKSFAQISKELGISSQAGIYRAMKKYDKVRTREQQLDDLKERNKIEHLQMNRNKELVMV